jgi:hypothetical protein
MYSAEFYPQILACWLQKAVGQGLPTSPGRLPLSYTFAYAIRLSVAGRWHLARHTPVADSLHGKSVTEGTNFIDVPLQVDKQIFNGDHLGLLSFLSTWN